MTDERKAPSRMDEDQENTKKAGGRRLVESGQEHPEYRGKRMLPSEADDELDLATTPPEEPTESDEAPAAPARKKDSWLTRLQDAAQDLSDQVLDWRDDMTDRFNDMAADPENDSLAAKMLRRSDEIVSGIADQQRETDQIMDEAATRKAERIQRADEVLNPDGSRPKFVFYTLENAPSKGKAGTPMQLEHTTLIDEDGQVISAPHTETAEAEQPAAAEPTEESSIDIPLPENDVEASPAASEDAPAQADEPTEEPDEQEPQPAPEFQRKAEPAPEEEPERPARHHSRAQGGSRVREPEPESEPEPPAPKPVVPPTPQAHKRALKRSRTVQYWLFFVLLAAFGLVGLFGNFRTTFSEAENRTLTEKPALSFSGLVNGSYFAQLDQWYDDTYPGRDRLATVYDGLGTIFGFGTDASVSEGSAQSESEVSEPPEESETPETSTATEESPTGETSQSEESESAEATETGSAEGTEI